MFIHVYFVHDIERTSLYVFHLMHWVHYMRSFGTSRVCIQYKLCDKETSQLVGAVRVRFLFCLSARPPVDF